MLKPGQAFANNMTSTPVIGEAMMTDFQIDDTMAGQAIGPQNGFLVSLRLTTPPPKYETPRKRRQRDMA